MSVLAGLRVAQLGDGLAASVCGRLFADAGAVVGVVGARRTTPLGEYLNDGKGAADVANADLIVVEGGPAALAAAGHDEAALRRLNPRAAIVLISPYGQIGPQADDPATDLTLMCASGIARLLTGQVDDLSEPPIRPVGHQSAFLGGLAGACAGMHALHARDPAVVDVSIQDALSTIAVTELTRAGVSRKKWPRKRVADGNGATVCILPASDGFTAISPREDKQWAAWLKAMGSPAWGAEPRFRTKPDRVANWDALHELMSEWSRQHPKQWIADTAQAARVPSFPLRELHEQLDTPQAKHRGFFRPMEIAGRTVRVPGTPFGLTLTQGPASGATPGAMPLSGIRVLDFSWVIAGPTVTRYLAAAGADVIKIEAPGRGDPGRGSELHTVLGQAKRAIVLDLKNPDAVAIARDLAANADVLVENYATGVMDRLGLGAEELREVNPGLIYISASGMGRTGPDSHAVAYGTLLQCYAGFAGLNRHPKVPPRVGLAWLDPMCGLLIAFMAAASLWARQRNGTVARVDFSMIEAMLWTMAEPLLQTQLGERPKPRGNDSDRCEPHGVFRCVGDDQWVGIAVRDDRDWRALCACAPALAPMVKLGSAERGAARVAIETAIAGWCVSRSAVETASVLARAGIPAAPVAGSFDLVESPHLRAQGFWDSLGRGVVPGLAWRASYGRAIGPAPGLGEHTDAVLRDVLGVDAARIGVLRSTGALG
jgi:crotonobetainyl-CoA:carnitine CoA-transferase CaiB-like acyl-CoA transferase